MPPIFCMHLGEDRQLFFGTCEDYRHSAAYHSFMDGDKAVHIWKKAAAKNPAPAAASPEPAEKKESGSAAGNKNGKAEKGEQQ